MSQERMTDAIGELDAALIDRYFETDRALPTTKTRRVAWIKWGALAACLCVLVAIGALLWHLFLQGPPIYDGAYLSASEVAGSFPVMNAGGATTSYTKVYRPESRPFSFVPLPTEDYVNVYRIQEQTKRTSEEEFRELIDAITPRLMAALGTSADAFEKQESSYSGILSMYYRKNDTLLHFEQTSGVSDYGVDFAANRVLIKTGEVPLTLNGRTVQVDQRVSEEELVASLEWVKNAVFEIFGRSFSSVRVVYDYRGIHEYGAEHIWVYYYDEMVGSEMGDHIELCFDNCVNWDGETVSADILKKCRITYYSYRIPIEEYYTTEAKCKLLSLGAAEELLEKGYVFGGHSCPICMAAQEAVSFDEYDYVDLEYIRDLDGDPARSVPFYAFYKRIGVSENGEILYAKTYVCAVEVKGLAEYFEGQAAKHNAGT